MIPVSTSIFNPDALASWAIETFDLSFPGHCRIVSIGVNHVYQLLAGSGEYFMRVTPHGWRSREQLLSELDIIEALHAAGIPVARAARMSNGTAVASLEAPEGERFVVLFQPAPGKDVREITLTHARDYGRLAARVHIAADTIVPQPDRFTIDADWLVHEPISAVHELFPGAPELASFAPLIQLVAHRLDEMRRESPMFGLCHGDLHPGNLRIADEGVQTLFDFDLSGYGWRIYDLTVFFWNAFGERRRKRWRDDRWRAFVGGYQDWRPLDPEILELVPLFLVARQVWLMGMDCRGSSGWPPQWLTRGWLQEMLRPIDLWREDYSILR